MWGVLRGLDYASLQNQEQWVSQTWVMGRAEGPPFAYILPGSGMLGIPDSGIGVMRSAETLTVLYSAESITNRASVTGDVGSAEGP